MFRSLRQLFQEKPRPRRLAQVPEGERYYVIGDVHGRLDLFDALVAAIEADDAALPAMQTTVVFLGDLIDRGPNSAAVIDRARAWTKLRKVRFIAGNHEEMFLQSFEDKEMLRHFIKHGGRETILSYGIKRKRYNELTVKDLQYEMDALVPVRHRKFLAGFEDMIVAGDYVFVHAGINPQRSIEEQKQSDLRWIRERFLKHSAPLSHVVVHGHTIFEQVEATEHRIGIDTGAFRSGRLTALVLEGTTRRTIQAIETDGTVTTRKADLD
ncbi:MAG: metallophosphoesterase family protein [Erythrobacter sp.]|jgi:serine/threonine protein phosphatase 1